MVDGEESEMLSYNNDTQSNYSQAPMNYESRDTGIARLQIDNEDIVNKVYNELTGREWVRQSDGRVLLEKTDDDPLCSDYGAKKIILFITSGTNKFVTLANLEKNEINHLLLRTAHTLTTQLAKNFKEYGINFRRLRQVKLLIMTHVRTNFSRSQRGFSAKLIGKQNSATEVTHIQKDDERRPSLFGQK